MTGAVNEIVHLQKTEMVKLLLTLNQSPYLENKIQQVEFKDKTKLMQDDGAGRCDNCGN